jgi:hypothetical protein
MPTSALILSAAILAGVLSADLGRKAVTAHRLSRPLIVAGVVGVAFLSAFATSGTGLALELAAAGTGAALGLLVAAFMHVEHDRDNGAAFTNAGAPYALLWVAVVGARLTFIYGSEHWFSGSLNSWMVAHHVGVNALTDALILLALSMTVARTLSLFVRVRGAESLRLGAVADTNA